MIHISKYVLTHTNTPTHLPHAYIEDGKLINILASVTAQNYLIQKLDTCSKCIYYDTEREKHLDKDTNTTQKYLDT